MGFTRREAVPELSAKEREALMEEKVASTKARLDEIKKENARVNNEKGPGKVELLNSTRKAVVNKLK